MHRASTADTADTAELLYSARQTQTIPCSGEKPLIHKRFSSFTALPQPAKFGIL
ncbi:hypothetical protein [Halopseudomonas pelagia]|uniref:hypothetical protein n=1 Tax=Halopseudomonas pelagia TaxID=553151 RepID=UPI0003A7AEF1|nr:hypothetical protein [Halopseudomonas pelagia]